MNVIASRFSQVTVKNITDDESFFINSQINQHLWAIKSIQQRCVLFHRQFPERRIKRAVMLKVMKMGGLRMKKVEI